MLTGISSIFSLVGIDLIDLVKGRNDAVLISRVSMFNPYAGTVGYTVRVENVGIILARDVEVTVGATGNLQIDRPSAHWRGLGASNAEEFTAARDVGFASMNLDQDILVTLTWKDTWRKRKAQDRFNLRQLEQEYRDQLSHP